MSKITREEYVRCGATWGTCMIRSAFRDNPHQCGENAKDKSHAHTCEHCGAVK